MGERKLIKEGYYGKEPFDARLAVLRLLFKAPLLILAILILTGILGGAYYVKNVVMSGPDRYEAKSLYLVTYQDPNWCEGGKYINEATWNDWVNAKYFREQLMEAYAKTFDMVSEKPYYGFEEDEASNDLKISVKVGSDLRMPSVYVVSNVQGLSARVSKAIDEVMTSYISDVMAEEVKSVEVVDPADGAHLVKEDVRVVRAFILSFCVATLIVITFFLLKEWGDDSLWVSRTIWKRFGVKTVVRNKRSLAKTDNMYYFKDCNNIAVMPVDEKADAEKTVEFMKSLDNGDKVNWNVMELASKDPKVYENIRKMDGVLLVVSMGAHASGRLEEMLELLSMQDCKVKAVIPDHINERMENLMSL